MANYLDYLRTLLADKMQQRFDPNYNEVQASLFNMNNKGKMVDNLLLGREEPVIGSDTKGQSLYSIMSNSPRWGDLVWNGGMADYRNDMSIRKPMTPQEMDALIQRLRQESEKQRKENMMMGGGI